MSKMFDKIKDHSHVTTFDNDSFCGLHIEWALKGVGFGELVLAYDKEEKKWTADRECMKKPLIKEILSKSMDGLADVYLDLDKDDFNDSGDK